MVNAGNTPMTMRTRPRAGLPGCAPAHWFPSVATALLLSGMLVIPQVAAAQAADAAGCSDPVMFPDRIPGDGITRCNASNTADEFRWPGGSCNVLGRKTELLYRTADGRARNRRVELARS